MKKRISVFLWVVLFCVNVRSAEWSSRRVWDGIWGVWGAGQGVKVVIDDFIVSFITRDKGFESGLPIHDIMNKVNRGLSQMAKEGVDDEDLLKSIRTLTESAGSVITGLPVKQMFNIAEGLSDVEQEEYAKGLLKIGGWTSYNVDSYFDNK